MESRRGGPRGRVLLAIDTSTAQAGVALMDDEVVLAEWSWMAEGNHSRHLTRVLREIMALQDITSASLAGIAVASGPGSFSGVRVGMSQAKGLAMARGIPLAGISTLDVIAFQASGLSDEVWAVTSAGRMHVNLAHYRGRDPHWTRTTPYQVATVDEALALVRGAVLLAGDGAGALVRAAAASGQDLPLLPSPWQLRRAGFLAELGRRFFAAGGADQLDQLEPLYLRASAAEEKLAAQRQE